MKSHTLTLSDGGRVFFIENFFPQQMADQLLALFLKDDTSSWQAHRNFATVSGRLVYCGDMVVLNNINDFVKTQLDTIAAWVNKPVKLLNTSLWKDIAGYHSGVHTDQDHYEYATQIYITDTPHLAAGTAIYQDLAQPVAQMAFRHNFGYLFDTAKTVRHAAHAIPQGVNRFSVYTRYQLA